ncbi:hypothetical protein SCUP234_08671 [Seiridium cupressi]
MPGSPHPHARRRRQGSPHPNAISDDSPHSRAKAASPAREDGPRVIQDNIPEFVSMAPAIFVPATFDYSQPRPSPAPGENGAATSRVDRALAELEDHMTAVKRNISTIMLQQARKVHQDSAAQELFWTDRGLPPRSKRLPPTRADEAQMIQNLEAKRVPDRQYGVKAGYGPNDVPPIAPHPKDTPREAAVVQLSDLMRYGTQQMEGYENHCVTARRETRMRVAKEAAEERARNLGRNMNIDEDEPGAPGDGDGQSDVPMDLD